MVNNFMCQKCGHFFVCDKVKHIDKFVQTDKKDLNIEITMNDCLDFDSGDKANEEKEDE